MKSSKAQIQAKVYKIPTLRFDEERKLTSYAGMVVFQALFDTLGLLRRFRQAFRHLSSGQVYGHERFTLILVVHFLLGFRRLREMDFYKEDPLIARVVGLRSLPDVSTMSRGLKNMDKKSVAGIRKINRDLILERLASEKFGRITVDYDGSVQSTNGHAEGTAVGFNKKKKGARSYYPLFATIAQTDQFFDLHHRSGNVHDSNGAPEFMSDCFSAIRSQCPATKLESRIDSAFFNHSIFPVLSDAGVEFTCSVPFERLPELKKRVEDRQRWQHIDSRFSYFETDWRPKSWTTSYRFIFVRQLKANRNKEPIQLDLFQPIDYDYDYRVIATNKTESARAIVLFHHGRGSQEKLFGEGKQNVALDIVATKRRVGNEIFTSCGMLAHNLSRELQMRSVEPSPRSLGKRPSRFAFLSLHTLRQRFLHRAGALIRPQGELTLAVNANTHVQNEVQHYLQCAQAA